MPYVHSIRARWLLLVAAALVAALAAATLASSRADAQVAPEARSQFGIIPLWTHHVEIKVPFRDVDGDGRNDYDPQFSLTAIRTAGPTPGSGDWCPPSLSMAPRVGENGSEVLATYTASLLDENCQFQTQFPETIASGVAGFTLSRASGAIAHVTHRNNTTARITYTDGRTTFQPNRSVSGFGPEDEGTVITLRFSRETGERGHPQCRIHENDRYATWRVDSRGRAIQQRHATLIDTLPPHAPDYGRECHYAARWPDIEGFITPTPSLIVLASGSGHRATEYRRIEVVEARSFKPSPQLVVPFTDYDGDGAHDYRGASLRVTFNRQSGEPVACSNDVTADYVIEAREHPAETITTADGDVMLRARSTLKPAEAVSLIDTPRNSQHHCQYDVEFGNSDEVAAGEQARLARLTAAAIEDTELSAADPLAFAAYENAAVSRTVTFAVAVPPAASSEGFGVAYEPVAAQDPGCTDGDAFVLAPDSNGQASRDVTLIDRWQGHLSAAARCEYTATWADSGDAASSVYQLTGAAQQTIDASVFDAADRTLLRAYGEVAPTFDAVLEVLTTAPDGQDRAFTVGVTTDPNADAGCSQIPDQEVVVTAGQTSGQTALNGVVERALGATTDCAYTIEWPSSIVGAVGWERDPTHSAVVALNSSVGVASARYYPVFDGVVEITTSQPVAADTTFTVAVAASSASPTSGCSDPDDLTLTVRAGSTSAAGSLSRLVVLPPGETGACAYEANWPASEDLAAAPPGGKNPTPVWAADQAHATTTQMTVRSRRVTHRYLFSVDTHFDADISVHVPQIEGPTAGVNLFAGAEFTFTFARAPHSHPGCSTGTPNSFIYTVQPDGSVTGDHPTPLVDVPAGGTESCVYLFHASSASAPPDAPIQWSLYIETVSATLQKSTPRPVVEYLVGDITFTPEVAIAVPQIDETISGTHTNVFADVVLADGTTAPLTFDVAFAIAAGSDAGCTDTGSTTYAYAVAPDGTVTGEVPALAAYVVTTDLVTHPVEQTVAPCVYDVTFPTASSGRAWLTKETDGSDDDATSAAQPSAMATYGNIEVVAPVDVAVMTPTFTPPPGRTVSVTISAAQGADAACVVDDHVSPSSAASRTKSVTLDASGTTRVVGHFDVTDLVAGATSANDRCAYDVAWSVTDEPFADAIWTRTTSDDALAASGRVGATSTLSATYAVPIETSFDATLNLVVVDHVPAGTAFAVSVDATADSPVGCSSTVNRTLTAPAVDGTNDRTIVDTFSLVHTPAGVVGYCTYEITWPLMETGGTLFVPDEAFTADTALSRQQPTATSRYSDRTVATMFSATLTVGTTQIVDVAATFSVGVAPAAGAPPGCSTPSPDPAVTVGPGASTQTLELSLVRRPPSENAECSYALTWSTSEDTTTFWMADATFTPDVTLTPSAPDAANRYAPDLTYFTPTLTFNVADADFDGDGSHDYAGAHFTVTFTSADADCSALTRAYELGGDGDVEPVAPFVLVDEHPSAACSYTVAFAPRSDETDAGVLLKFADASDDETVTASDASAAATYRETVTRFDANLYLGGTHTIANEDAVNPIPAGTPFTVTVRPQANAPAGCDADPASDETGVTVTILKAEVVERQPHTQLTRTLLAGLIADTEVGEHCVYDVEWPTNEDAGTQFIVDVDPARPFSNTVRAGTADDVGAVVWYRADPTMVQPPEPPDEPMDEPMDEPIDEPIDEPMEATTFVPSISVTVPLLDGATAGENIWSGTTFPVTLARVGGSHSDCSLMTSEMLTYTVDSSGAVATADTVPETLIDATDDGTTCAYTVTYGPAPTADANAELSWMMTAPATAELTATVTSAQGDYTVGDVTFVPDVDITVPTGNDAKTFDVSFVGSRADCSGNPTTATLTYAVQGATATTAEPEASNRPLIAYPAGAATTSELCSYTAAFPDSENDGTTLALQSGADTEATGTDQVVAATYAAAPVTPPVVRPPPSTGGTSGPRTPSGGGSGGRSSGGGTSTPPDRDLTWEVVGERAEVAVSLMAPEGAVAAGATVELYLSVAGDECGEDLILFAGLPAGIGVVYAHTLGESGVADITSGANLLVGAQLERGSSRRDCQLRVSLVSGPTGCSLAGTEADEPGAVLVDAAAGVYTSALALSCDAA